MKIALVTPHYIPTKTSCAVQMSDLAEMLLQLGHEPIVITPQIGDSNISSVEKINNVEIFRFSTFDIFHSNHIKRTINEILLPICMILGIKRSNFPIKHLDAVIWYSPSIFLGPVVKFLIKSSKCPAYLILRDIFPEWALDLGLLKKNLLYFFFKWVANYNYSLADIIGVQTKSNLEYFKKWNKNSGQQVEVLNNWISRKIKTKSNISFYNTNLENKKIFIYMGNAGIAQDIDIFIELIDYLKYRKDIGFLFLVKESVATRLKTIFKDKNIINTLFLDLIRPEEINSLLKMCHVGLVALNVHHKTHNIPGKFIAYMNAGLPVLARVNPGTDLEKLIQNEKLGFVYTGSKVKDFAMLAEKLIDDDIKLKDISSRCYSIVSKMFSSELAAKKIVSSLLKYI
jgi:glycosyltransferase involved in cell wall biosynthesis